MKNGTIHVRSPADPVSTLRVCVIHQDPAIRAELANILISGGYTVHAPAAGTAQFLHTDDLTSFDVLLMPGAELAVSGTVLRRIRGNSVENGVIALANSEDDVPESGADDYLLLPVRPRELLFRVQAVLKRLRPNQSGTSLRVGDCELDLKRRCFSRSGQQIRLTKREFQLLALMMRRAGTPLSHQTLLQSVWGPEYGSELEYLRVYMRLLRRKLEANPSNPDYIRTEPGYGYCFHAPKNLVQ